MPEILGTIYTNVSDDFQRGIYPTARTVKAEKHDLAVVEMEERRFGNIYGFDGGNYAGNVYDKENLSPTIRTFQGGCQQPMIVAMRGRNPDNPSDRAEGSPTEQRLEPNSQGICNTLTSVQKDNMVLETTVKYRIRKLTPLECWRLIGFSDDDFFAAKLGNREEIKKIRLKAAYNGIDLFQEVENQSKMSNSQLYKQAGNSIVKPVLMAIFSQMIPEGKPRQQA